nr:putative ribonuclease H-like domain-containing protein [Tanacetum cinerariifolium]
MKDADCPRVININNTENARKSTVKYAEMYRNISKETYLIFLSMSPMMKDMSHLDMKVERLLAEAVNTACYVQNRVLVNKSQNKTPYELFNSRIPAIGFLRPFGCHVMILNTLDHLGKFDAKGDECYFVGYSLSSKAFRVFNKRTKKVEENLHVDFLENKLIKRGVGTKDIASKAVKKDVSSFRYIALPNWFHEAHIETSNDTIRNSDEQDDYQKEQDCNDDVPESSGISNPTVTLKVPSADQVEPTVSLTAESDILTASSRVPTVCLDISPERSSGSRLISKGVVSQKKTPSLGNALSLSNRLEDTFGVEADLSNIETSIPHPGFQDPEFLDRVYKVEKAMHGLHQTPRAWYGTLFKYLLDNGFQRGTIDQTLFIRKHKGEFLLVQVYVDDIIFGSSNLQLCREFEALMHDKFQMNAMGELTFFLGLQVLKKKDGIFFSQDKYAGDILKKFGYSDVRSTNTPMDKENPWRKDGPVSGKKVDPSWQCKKQTIVATSTTEAKYVVAASGCGQVLWIQNQMLDYGYNFMNTKIYI